MKDLLQRALDECVAGGASYADVRAVETTVETITVKGPAVEACDRTHSIGFGARVLMDGAWGFGASSHLTNDEAALVARTALAVAKASGSVLIDRVELVPEPSHRGTWATPLAIHPFGVSLEDKLSLLTSATESIESTRGIEFGRGTMDFIEQRTWFVSSEGSDIDQTIVHCGAGIEAFALSGDELQQRSYPASFRGHFEAGGFEIVQAMDLPGNAHQTAEQAAALLSSPECPSGPTTLVLDGHQVMLQVHESVGHPTELDRVLGMEAAFAGTSFVGLRDRGVFRYGSELVNITADATSAGGLGTFAYDDEGVEAQSCPLIESGILVGFQSSRETAGATGASRSNGTMRAEGWENLPLIRMTNVNLHPHEGSTEDLIAGVDDGIYMATNKSWSIDDKRKTFQFGCEIAWEIKNGRLGRMLKDPRYTGIMPEFWGSCDGIAGPEEWRMWGTPNCGKGQPGQTMRVGHGTSPARFRNVSVGFAQ